MDERKLKNLLKPKKKKETGALFKEHIRTSKGLFSS